VTEIELLSNDRLDDKGETTIKEFLSSVQVVGLTENIKETAIKLRRSQRLTIPDAIIVATAVSLDAQLLTNDARLLNFPGIRCRSVQLKK